jgi:hypothetical protein
MMPADDLRGLGDVLLDRKVDAAEVRSALCALLSFGSGEVAVVESQEQVATLDGEVPLLCMLFRLGDGDFPTLLSINGYLLPDQPRIRTVARLCRLLGCRCLIDDGSISPFTFLLVDGGGGSWKVGVDPDRTNRDEYVIRSIEPLPQEGDNDSRCTKR